jgi:arginine repressor
MKQMRHQFQVSQATILRCLNEYGYLTSCNCNAAYYTLHDVPQFDDRGLWAFGDVRFSKFDTLSETIVALVQNAHAGMTVAELEDQLNTKAANLLCRLVQEGRLRSRTLAGRRALYLAADPAKAERQFQRRQKMLAPAQPAELLPPGLDAEQVIQILRQMVASGAKPEPLARQLARRGVAVTASQVRQVIDHYALKKKRRTLS